ncbi:MAG TPA: isopentenyl transferase family protein, partial [Acidimicrobiia bacterium]|nr:isopentenyl transferase family protein [Acidimicrobiia bacterium]
MLGPTAAGKTEVAVQAAERIGAEIISVDSMQVY